MSAPPGPKMKSFNIGVIGKRPANKRDQDRQKKEDEEKAAAEAYEEFVAAFDDNSKHGKVFVRGAVINAGSGEEKQTSGSGKLYKPNKMVEVARKMEDKHHYESSSSSSRAHEKQQKKKDKEQKKKSNLELFKEELKIIQEEREERHRLKGSIKESCRAPKNDSPTENQIKLADEYRLPGFGSYDTGDPNTTNLYLGNLNPKMTEQQLCEIFGRFGPLASVKIMWPRSDEERARGRNCGFVAFMNRKDGERAMKSLNGKDVMSFEMKLGWGKAIPIPPHPVYIPPAMAELTIPPPPSGLPFNAQPGAKKGFLSACEEGDDDNKENIDQILANAVVKVVIPTERSLLCLIHRMVEFVVREGPMFEAMIMNREINNPMFRFLFDNQSPAHIYYRWRLFSILQGDHPSKWRTEEFQMFHSGSYWRPPPLNPYLQGMPDELVEKAVPAPTRVEEPKKGMLSDSMRDRLEDLLRTLTPEKPKLAEAMIYCVDHAEAAEEIVDCIAESLSILQTALHKKIARIYLVSDILHNCSVKVANASFYRKGFQAKLPDIFKDIHDCFKNIEGRLKAEQFKQRVMNCFRAWEDWAIYPNDFLIKLQNIFLGLVAPPAAKIVEEEVASESVSETEVVSYTEDLDGMPLGGQEDVDLDGVPLGAHETEDIDGIPLSDELDGQPLEDNASANSSSKPKLKFVPSKWESVDPETVEAQAITTSKWDLLDQQEQEEVPVGEDLDGQPIDEDVQMEDATDHVKEEPYKDYESLKHDASEERRAKLREIEVKVMKFQDELESGRRSRKSHHNIADQVEHYRQKLIHKILRDDQERSSGNSRRRETRSPSPSISRSQSSDGSRSSRSPSPSYHRLQSLASKKIGPRFSVISKPQNPASPRRKSQHSRSPKKTRSGRSRSRSPRRPLRRSRSRSPHRRRVSISPPSRKHKKRKH